MNLEKKYRLQTTKLAKLSAPLALVEASERSLLSGSIWYMGILISHVVRNINMCVYIYMISTYIHIYNISF